MATDQKASAAGFDRAGAAQLKTGLLGKLDTQLAALYLQNATVAPLARAAHAADLVTSALLASVHHFAGSVVTDTTGERFVVIDATAADGNGGALLGELQALGLKGGASFGGVASGYLPTSALGAMANLANLKGATESAFASHAGLVTQQGDVAQHSDIARATYGVDGTGLKIGVLSDSFNTSPAATSGADDMKANIASGDLPSQIKILQDSAGGTDEGRAMAQLIHDVAPGAAIDFATANGGQANFANNILRLAADGARVIVDDIIYFTEPAYQDGIIAQAINKVAAAGVSYFSSAGNDGNEGYEQHWVSGSHDADYQYLEFAPGQESLPFVASGYDDVFVMQWDQPSASAGGAGAQSDLDIFVVDSAGKIVGGGGADNIKSGNPQEAFAFQGKAGETYQLVVGLFSGPAPNFVKIMALGNGSGVDLGTTERNINDATAYGHVAAAGTIGVGAAFYFDTPAYGTSPALLESYSSNGPTRIVFDAHGDRLATPELRQTVDVTALDGGNTTFFGFDIPARYADADTYPNFFGTSAAAPDAAGVALLLLQANSKLTNTDVAALLKDSAIDMDNPFTSGFDKGIDQATGAGLVQADAAVRYAVTGVIDNQSAVALTGTHLNDTIIAGAGANTINGGAGNDDITGGGGNDVLTGGAGADIFRFDSAGISGNDHITDFGSNDAIALTKALFDSNKDGIITYASNGNLLLDNSKNGDKLILDGVAPAQGLRSLGSTGGQYYYAEAAVRPGAARGQTVTEGTVGNDSLSLTTKGSHVLFIDNGGAAPTGIDRVTGFTSSDILVTTQALDDRNGDGLIATGGNRVFDLGNGGSVALGESGGKPTTVLEFDGSVQHNGVMYYVYSLPGSAAGISDLHFAA